MIITNTIIFHKSVTKLISDIFEEPKRGVVMMKHQSCDISDSSECALYRTSRLNTVACTVSEKFTKI